MSKIRLLGYTVLVLALLVSLTAPAAAEEEERKVRVQIKRVHGDCEEGEDCQKKVVIRKRRGHSSDDEHVVFSSGQGRHRTLAFTGAAHGKGGFLGVMFSELTPELRTHFGVPEDAGVLISKIIEGTPAEAAGLQVGDIVTAVDGETVDGVADLAHAVRSREAGETIVVEAWRDGRLQQISATLGERAEERHAARHSVHCAEGDDCEAEIHGIALDLDGDFEWTGDHSFNFDFHKNLNFDFDCGDGEDCDFTIECDDGECACTANGEATDCPDGVSALHEGHR